jgi:hypothetical protein
METLSVTKQRQRQKMAILKPENVGLYTEEIIYLHLTCPYTDSPRLAPVQFAPIQNNADFETRRSKSEKKKILL